MGPTVTEPERARRSYEQYCGIARALDLVGERWTLLLVRELLLGPQRYNDLLAGLPGIGTNLLAKRLKDLEQAGIIERQVLPRPANVAVYALTRQGRGLERAVVELGRFGGRFLPQHPDASTLSARTAATGLKMTFHPAQAPGTQATYALDLDDQTFAVTVDGEQLDVRQGEANDAQLVVRTTARSFLELLSGAVSTRDALRSPDFEFTVPDATGRAAERVARARVETFVDLFGWARRAEHR